VKLGADYISVGPIFATPSKPGREPVGLNLLKKAVNRIKIPVVAIGGINRSNATRVIKAGGHRVAVIRAASEAKSIIDLIR
jgi:thiamine-phosphate pyrophosphorylase